MKKLISIAVFIGLIITESYPQECRVWPLGVCTNFSNAMIVKATGFAYLEESVQTYLIPNESDAVFLQKLEQSAKAEIKVAVCNNFLPSNLKCVGPRVNTDSIVRYADVAFKRAQKANVKIIVFACGNSRSIPQGWPVANARKQLVSLLKQLSVIASKYKVTLAFEPLNRYETNFINTIEEGVALIKEVDSPNVKLTADFYHMIRENESPEVLIKAGKLLVHCHLAERARRTPPGVYGDSFIPFFDVLKKLNYKGNISIECSWSNLSQQIGPAYTQLDKQMCNPEE
jgi:sugar phosphate isomerase/epimerase